MQINISSFSMTPNKIFECEAEKILSTKCYKILPENLEEKINTQKFILRNFCNEISKIVYFTPQALSPCYLRSRMDTNPELFYMLLLKRFCHVFSLKGKLDFQDNLELDLEGFHDLWSLSVLRASFEDFSDSQIPLVCPDLRRWMKDSLLNASCHGNINEISQIIRNEKHFNPMVVCSGWKTHSIIIIFYNNFFILCNRGADSSKSPGWTLYQIGNRGNLTNEFIESLINCGNYDQSNYFSKEKIIDHLQAKEIFYFNMKQQAAGNCTYSSGKAAIAALITLWVYQQKFSNEILNKEIMERVISEALLIYKPFTDFDRQMVLDDFLIDLENYDNGMRTDSSTNNMLFNSIDKIKRIIAEKIYSDQNIFTFGGKIGWERWLRLDHYLTTIRENNFSDQKTLRDVISLLFCNKENSELEKRLAALLLRIKNYKFLEIFFASTQVREALTCEQVLNIVSLLKQNRKNMSYGFLVKLCKTFDQRIELSKKIILRGDEGIVDLFGNCNFSDLGFIDDVFQSKNFQDKIELIGQIALLGSLPIVKLRANFSKFLLVEDIFNCCCFEQRLEFLTEMISLGRWVLKSIKSFFLQMGFVENLKSCDNFYKRLEKLNQLSSLGADIIEILDENFEEFGFIEDIMRAKSPKLKLAFCSQIPRYGQWAIKEIYDKITLSEKKIENKLIQPHPLLVKIKYKRKYEQEVFSEADLNLKFKRIKKG